VHVSPADRWHYLIEIFFPQQSGSRSYIALADTRYKSTCELYVSALKAHDCALFGAACGENEISSSSFFSFFFFVIWFCYYRRYMNYCMYDVPHFSPGHVYTRYSVITIMDATVHRRRVHRTARNRTGYRGYRSNRPGPVPVPGG
jgi:hypothetical protein